MSNLKDNAYIKHLENTLGNNFYSLKDEEYRKMNESQDYENFPDAPIIDGFFTFYLDGLNYSPEELFSVFKKKGYESALMDVLFSSHYSKARQRDDWIEKFTPLLNSNISFFKDAFKVCLDTHHYLENVKERNSTSLEDFDIFREKLIQRNTKAFTNLIAIGKEKDYFSNFKKEDFFTKNKSYQDILKLEGVFNDSISAADLKNHLAQMKSNKSNNTSFMATYINDIVDMKNDPYFFSTLGNYVEDFVVLFFSERFPISNEQFESFTDFLLDNPISHSAIRLNKSAINKIFYDFPNLVQKLIDNVPDKEKYFKGVIFNENLIDNYNRDVSKWIGAILSQKDYYNNKTIANNLYVPDQSWDTLFETMKQYNKDNSKELHNYIGRVLFNYLYHNQYSRITNIKREYNLSSKTDTSQNVEEYISAKLAQQHQYSNNIELVKKYAESLGYCNVYHNETYSMNNSYDRHNVNKLISPVLEYIGFISPELKEKISHKISTNFGLEVYQQIYHLNDNNSQYSSYRSREDFIKNLAKFISSTKMIGVLDLLHNDAENPLWLTTNFDIELEGDSTNNKRKRFREQYPLAFLLCDLTSGKALDWFIQPDKLEQFSNIKYKGKNFVTLFSSESWFPNLLKNIIQYPEVIEKLIFESKPAIKALNKLFEDPKYNELKTLFNFTKLSNSIEAVQEDKEEKIAPRRKI